MAAIWRRHDAKLARRDSRSTPASDNDAKFELDLDLCRTDNQFRQTGGSHMQDGLRAGVESLSALISAKESEIAELKRAANIMCRQAGMDPLYADTNPTENNAASLKMRPDEYYGKAFSTAARMYLERRRSAVPAEEIMRGLEQGSFDFDAQGWPKDDRLRLVALSLSKNTAIFHKLPSGLIGLKEWYPDAIERKKGKKNDEPKEAQKDEAASE
jgi:hypothetical protein